VGRGPLDEEAIRTLEAGNPDLEFDWTRILKGQSEPAAEERREEGQRPDRRNGERRDRREGSRGRDRRASAGSGPSAPVQPVEHAEAVAPVAQAEGPTTAAHARLGSEGLARLRARFSELLARIEERVEPERQEQLKAVAERLNPDAWVTEADVSAGLESYEVTFAELRNSIPSARSARPAAGGADHEPAGLSPETLPEQEDAE
jgi:hypothetical protein